MAMTCEAYGSLFGDPRMISKDYVNYATIEQGSITHFAGFKIIMTDYMPGGDKAPKKVSSDGSYTKEDEFTVTTKDNPKIKSRALFWERSALCVAIWKQVNVKLMERSEYSGETFLYASAMVGATRTEESRIGYIELEV